MIDFHLEELEQEELALSRNEQSIKIVRNSFCFKFRVIYRPMQIILGILLSLIALLIFVSLLLSNINKCIHFTSFQQIFAQGNKTLPNPIDIILTWTGGVSEWLDSLSIEIHFLLIVLSDELYRSVASVGLYYLHLDFWFTTAGYLVFVCSCKLMIGTRDCLD